MTADTAIDDAIVFFACFDAGLIVAVAWNIWSLT